MIRATSSISNDLKDVISTIQGYSGCKDVFAALAQEPVQNSKDNPMPNSKNPPSITYEIKKYKDSYMLIITDEYTTGLDGAYQTEAEVESLLSKYEIDKISNHSAFFADNITTKDNKDSSGSRGQGKKAALYHGRYSLNDDPNNQRILVFIDTNTRDENLKNTYRASLMYFLPRKNTIGPLTDREAKKLLTEINFNEIETISGEPMTNSGIKEDKLHLDLKPLTKAGTRIVIPYLNHETVEKFLDGTMVRWLERIWWNSILEEKVNIYISIDGKKTKIKCLDIWKNKPWENEELINNSTKSKGIYIKENIKIKGTSEPAKRILGKTPNLTIKRIVFDWDIDREEDEIQSNNQSKELSGLQWIRNNQWIFTRNINQLASFDSINNIDEKEKFYQGFRGFIEFDEETCRVLKDDSIETPQHHDINSNVDIEKIYAEINNAFTECAEKNDWSKFSDETIKEEIDSPRAILDLGVWGIGGEGNKKTKKKLDSKIQFLASNSNNLFMWNDEIKNISISLYSLNDEPLSSIVGDKKLLCNFKLKTPSGSVEELNNLKVEVGLKDLNITCKLPSLKIDKTKKFKEIGKYDLIAQWTDSKGKKLSRSTRSIFVEEISEVAPPPPFNIVTSITNLTTNEETNTFSFGDKIKIEVGIKNRTQEDLQLHATSLLGSLQLLDKDFKATIKANNLEDEYNQEILFSMESTIQPESHKEGNCFKLPKGRTELLIDVYDLKVLDGSLPTLQDLVSDKFVLNQNHRFLKKSLFIDIEGEGSEYYKIKYQNDPWEGQPKWEYEDSNYLFDPLPLINVFKKHPLSIKAENSNSKNSHSFKESDFLDIIDSEITISLLIERHFYSGDNNDDLNNFINFAERLNTKDKNAKEKYKYGLNSLKYINSHDFKEIDKIKSNLIAALYSMIASSYNKYS